MTGPTTTGETAPLAAGLPFLGSLLDLRRDPLATYLRAQREHGDVVRFVAGPPGMRLTFYGVFSAAGAQQVLGTDAARFRKDNKFYAETRESLGNGLLTSQDEEYQRQRRLIQPLFRHRTVDGYAAIMTDEVRQAVAGWGPEVDLVEESARMTLRVVARAIFGADVDAAVDVVRRSFPVLGEYSTRRGFEPLSVPRRWPTPGNRRAADARRELWGVCDQLVAERRRAADDGAVDLLSLLARATDADGRALSSSEVRDQVLIFLMAGHETTATSLVFALHLLARRPAVQARLRAEADEVLGDRTPGAADLHALSYATKVLKETLRLYPPAPLMGRRAVEDTVVDGRLVPAGSDVLVMPWVTHRNPQYWPEPDLFEPERFAPEREAERPRYAWYPFGGGPRACIGQHFSMLESVLALVTVLREVELEAADDEVALTHGITLQPVGRVACVTRPRGPAGRSR